MGDRRPPGPEHGPANGVGQESAGPGAGPSTHGPAGPPPEGESGSEPTTLRDTLRHGSPSERSAAVQGARPGPGLEAVLIEALDDPDPGVRVTAIRALGTVARTQGTRALMRTAAVDPSPAARAEAVASLGRILEARLGPDEEPPPLGRPA
jgi:hypothetical protein